MPRDKRAWLFQRKDRPGWWVGWYHNGKLRKKKCDNKAHAQRHARRLEGQLNADMYFEPSNKRWDQFLKEYRDNQQIKKGERSIKEEDYVLNRFTKECQPDLLSAISIHTIEQYLAYRYKSRVSPATQNKDLRILRLVFNYAVKKRYIRENPSVGLDFSPVDRKIPRILTPKEFEKLLGAIKEIKDQNYSLRWHTIISILWSTGMRPSEMLKLTLDDIDLRGATIKVHSGKTHQERIVSIFFKDAIPVLAEYIEKMSTDQKKLFKCDSSKLGKQFRKIRKQAGLLDVVMYDLRRTLGSWMAANGFSPAQIAAQLGHSSYKTSERYYVNARPSVVEKAGQFKSPVAL
jgi:site-specific recombinase XerD